MAEFGSVEHIRALSRRELENLFRYVFNSRNDLNTIITQQDAKITELRRRVANQSRQLKAVQVALEKRNQGEMKARWQRAMDTTKAENERLQKLVRHLRECTRHNVCAACEYADDTCDFDYEMRELGVTDG